MTRAPKKSFMKKGKIFIISGPSGSGKTTLYKNLLLSAKFRGKLVKSISMTTRAPRKGERHGRDYFFISRAMFKYKRSAGQFLESKKVFDNDYGTPHKFVRDSLRDGKHVLLCIDVKGAREVIRKYPRAVTLFIKTKTFGQLKQRLLKRGSEKDEVVALRLQTAKKELREAPKYKYIIINENLKSAQSKLEKIVLEEIDT